MCNGLTMQFSNKKWNANVLETGTWASTGWVQTCQCPHVIMDLMWYSNRVPSVCVPLLFNNCHLL